MLEKGAQKKEKSPQKVGPLGKNSPPKCPKLGMERTIIPT